MAGGASGIRAQGADHVGHVGSHDVVGGWKSDGRFFDRMDRIGVDGTGLLRGLRGKRIQIHRSMLEACFRSGDRRFAICLWGMMLRGADQCRYDGECPIGGLGGGTGMRDEFDRTRLPPVPGIALADFAGSGGVGQSISLQDAEAQRDEYGAGGGHGQATRGAKCENGEGIPDVFLVFIVS